MHWQFPGFREIYKYSVSKCPLPGAWLLKVVFAEFAAQQPSRANPVDSILSVWVPALLIDCA